MTESEFHLVGDPRVWVPARMAEVARHLRAHQTALEACFEQLGLQPRACREGLSIPHVHSARDASDYFDAALDAVARLPCDEITGILIDPDPSQGVRHCVGWIVLTGADDVQWAFLDLKDPKEDRWSLVWNHQKPIEGVIGRYQWRMGWVSDNEDHHALRAFCEQGLECMWRSYESGMRIGWLDGEMMEFQLSNPREQFLKNHVVKGDRDHTGVGLFVRNNGETLWETGLPFVNAHARTYLAYDSRVNPFQSPFDPTEGPFQSFRVYGDTVSRHEHSTWHDWDQLAPHLHPAMKPPLLSLVLD